MPRAGPIWPPLDYDGKVLWTATPLRYRSEHGYHHNPLLLGDLLVLSFDQLAEAAVLGLDARTGQTRWRVPLANDEPSNVAPLPVESEGRTLVMTSGNDVTRALDPRDGRVVVARGGTDEVLRRRSGPGCGRRVRQRRLPGSPQPRLQGGLG